MEELEKDVFQRIRNSIIKSLEKTELISINYNDRIPLPRNIIQEVYQSLDIEIIKQKLKERLEEELANKIANSLITEFSNDVKQIMSNKELREEMRAYTREKIKSITDKLEVE